MPFIVSIAAVCPIRKEPSHRSEMVSQLLAGEVAELISSTGDFVSIKTLYDQYEGWCQRNQLIFCETISMPDQSLLSKGHSNILYVDDQPMYISAGTPLHLFLQNTVHNYSISYKGDIWDPATAVFNSGTMQTITDWYSNVPYLWGGRSVFGIDCSGFSQQVYRYFGIQLPRDAYQQAALGESVGFLQEVQCGDLAFFDNAEGRITHVGIMLSPDRIIHASGQVRTDAIDNMGIIHSKTGQRTHQLRIIKRYRVLVP
jgi:gamma-D-glutamyl-L-lysine dipeptidyl-peptidase